MKDRSAIVAFIICALFVLIFIFILPVSALFGLDITVVIKNYPILGVAAPGGLMILFGILLLVFKNEAGMWSAKFRQGIADKYPAWKRMAGLPEDKIAYYFSFEFNRKLVVVAAWINLAVGLVLVVIAMMISAKSGLF